MEKREEELVLSDYVCVCEKGYMLGNYFVYNELIMTEENYDESSTFTIYYYYSKILILV